jgi:hypothetical protein
MTEKTATIGDNSGDFIGMAEKDPAKFVDDKDLFDALVAQIKDEMDALPSDMEKAKDRDKVRAFAYQISKIKSAIDAAGKGMGDDARDLIKRINAKRNVIVSTMDDLRDESRDPLTKWEKAEEDRKQYVIDTRTTIQNLGRPEISEKVAGIRVRLEKLVALEILEDNCPNEESAAHLRALAAEGREKLANLITEMEEREAAEAEAERIAEEERAELARLRAAEAERAKEAEKAKEAERIASEAAEAERQRKERLAEQNKAADDLEAELDGIRAELDDKATDRGRLSLLRSTIAATTIRAVQYGERSAALVNKANELQTDLEKEIDARFLAERSEEQRKASESASYELSRVSDMVTGYSSEDLTAYFSKYKSWIISEREYGDKAEDLESMRLKALELIDAEIVRRSNEERERVAKMDAKKLEEAKEEAAAALMQCGRLKVSPAAAKAIIEHIAGENVPHVSFRPVS